VATALNDTHMEEGIARAISQRDEAKAFVRVVPFDDSLDGWTGRAVELWAAWRRISEIAGRWLVVVVGEITAAAWAEISVSVAHVRSQAKGPYFSDGGARSSTHSTPPLATLALARVSSRASESQRLSQPLAPAPT
jgi:hypothetical protein